MPYTFTATVYRLKRDATTGKKEVGSDGQDIREEELGQFTFRVPTVRDEMEIAAKRQQMCSQAGDPRFMMQDVYYDFFYRAEILATIPKMVTAQPEGWDWEEIYDNMTIVEIYEVYKAELEAFRKKKKLR